ncbi:hypothetical protein [Gordonia paraffinivorans]|uniref:DUF8020 domain-containing protein n=1 Tax=Gordonia paraffinivorans NBRC 108238 TaxID=1223543 RepID=A0ABQ0IHM2_9ACTN|nr:hypothetical protein [Gordonia paraffinivorans]MCD2146689.1 hypothetical protein [Gordonia paraffinivorans]GAC83085.1 hypothetical protein GP2_008_00850 [Gordonia paraffinivorans NBRC 108238]
MKHLRAGIMALAMMGAVLVAVPVATAHAAPAVTALPTVSAALADDNTSVIVDVRGGTVAVTPTALQILDGRGRTVTSMPLSGQMDGFTIPLRAAVGADRTRVALTPTVPADYRALLDAAAKKDAAKPLTKAQRYDIMWQELNKGWRGNTPLYTLIGGLVGFIVFGWIGAGVGAFIGAYIGYGETNPKAWPSVVAWFNTP